MAGCRASAGRRDRRQHHVYLRRTFTPGRPNRSPATLISVSWVAETVSGFADEDSQLPQVVDGPPSQLRQSQARRGQSQARRGGNVSSLKEHDQTNWWFSRRESRASRRRPKHPPLYSEEFLGISRTWVSYCRREGWNWFKRLPIEPEEGSIGDATVQYEVIVFALQGGTRLHHTRGRTRGRGSRGRIQRHASAEQDQRK